MVEDTVKIAPYIDKAFESAMARRTHAFWGIAALGIAYGAATGLVAPFFPCFVGAQSWSEAAALVPTSVAVFSGVGLLGGFGIGATIGAPSGAAASVAEEQERRMRERDLALGISTPAQEAAISKMQETKPDNRSLLRKFVETINVRNGLIFATIGAIGGAVLAAAYVNMGGGEAFALPGLKTILGSAAGDTRAVTAYFVGMMATFGAMFGTDGPKLVNHMRNYVEKIFSGKALTLHKEGPQPMQQVVREQEVTLPTAVHESSCGGEHKKFASFQDMLTQRAQSAENAPSQTTHI